MSDAVILVRGISKSYPSGEKRLIVLRELSLEVKRGSTVSVVGESGAGKSTLLHLLGGLDRVDEGQIFLESVEISRLSAVERAEFRNRKVGYVFQLHHLLPEFTAEENVMLPCLIRRETAREAWRKARSLLEELGLEERAGHRPAELSGGEQQRVAIARALVGSPSILLADEPTGNLDFHTSESVYSLIREAAARRNATTILVTHSERLARRSDRVYVMVDGILEDLEDSDYKFGLETPAIPL